MTKLLLPLASLLQGYRFKLMAGSEFQVVLSVVPEREGLAGVNSNGRLRREGCLEHRGNDQLGPAAL